MAVDEFGGIIQESAPQGVQVDEFGGIISSQPTTLTTPLTRPLTLEETIAQNLTRQEQRSGVSQAIEALMTPPMAGIDIAKGIVNTGVEGVQGLANLLGAGSIEDTTKPTSMMDRLIKAALMATPGTSLLNPTQARNLAQTGLEVIPRATYDLGQSAVALASDPNKTLALVNPVQAAIQQILEGSRTPTQSEIQQAVDSQQLSQALEEVGQQPIAPEIFGEANIPAARAAPLLLGAETAVPALRRGISSAVSRASTPLETIASRGVFSKPLEDAITRTTGITASEGSLEAAPIVKTRISEWPGKPPSTAKEFVDVANKAQTSVLQDALAPLREAEKTGLVMKGDSMISSGRQAVLDDFPSLANDVEAIDNVLTEFAYLKGDLKPTQGQGFLRELNRRYNGLENKNSPAASAYRAIRSELSNQTDEIIKAQTGKDISPYRDWGQLEEFKNGVQEQITAAQRTQGGRELPSGGGIPTTSRGAVLRAARSLPVARAFVPRAIESVDQGIRRILKEVKSLPKDSALAEDAINGLRSKYQPSINTPVPISVETQIQELIASYPNNIRSNPSLARAVAEAELAGQYTPTALTSQTIEPLGLNRPIKINQNLREISDEGFQNRLKQASQKLDEAESDPRSFAELSQKERSSLGKLQDDYNSLQQESFRRESQSKLSQDIFKEMADLSDSIDLQSTATSQNYFKFKTLYDILKKRSVSEKELTGSFSELPKTITGDPSFQEVLKSKFDKTKQIIESF